jgi:hypothetical protein
MTIPKDIICVWFCRLNMCVCMWSNILCIYICWRHITVYFFLLFCNIGLWTWACWVSAVLLEPGLQPFLLLIFQLGSPTLPGTGVRPRFSYFCLSCSWSYSYVLPCPAMLCICHMDILSVSPEMILCYFCQELGQGPHL